MRAALLAAAGSDAATARLWRHGDANDISRELPPDLLLVAKWRVELGDLEHRVKLRKLLGRRDLPLKIRGKAPRSMLGYRWAMALREKPLGYPNLAKAREALMRKAAERRRQTDSSASPP